MLPASNKGPSFNFGFPDVCLTPVGPVVVPIPYPNFGAHAMAVPFSPVVSVAMIPALNMASVIPLTTGDEPGVAHWTVMGPGTFDLGSPVVFVDLLPAIHLTCPTDGNTGNDEPSMVVAPGAPNVLYTLARDTAPGAADAPDTAPSLDGSPLVGPGRFVGEGIACLAVRVFSWRLPSAFEAEVSRLRDAGMAALIVDLRGCPGGELQAFLELASDLLDRGAEICTTRDAEGDPVTHRARRAAAHTFPLALLVDETTASAAELFAACLHAHGRATVLGAPTYGKRSAQILWRGPSGEPVSVTAAHVSPPPGASAVLDAEGRVSPHLPADASTALAAAVAHLEQALSTTEPSPCRK